MSHDSPSAPPLAPLGSAWIAWAFLLCGGGIVALVALQRGPLDASLSELMRIAFWTRGAAVLMLATLALGAGMIGRTLRRGQPVARWQVAALGFGAAAALVAGGFVLARGIASRWLLVGDELLATSLFVAGLGTLLLAGASTWLGGVDREVWPGYGESIPDRDGNLDAAEELATLSRIASLTLAGYLALSLFLTASVLWLELAARPND